MKLPVIKQIQRSCSVAQIETAITVLENTSEALSLKEEELNVIGELISNMCGALEVHELIASGMSEKDAGNAFMKKYWDRLISNPKTNSKRLAVGRPFFARNKKKAPRNFEALHIGYYNTMTLLLLPKTLVLTLSASGSFNHSEAFTRYLNSCCEFLGKATSALKLPSFFLLITIEFSQSLFKPKISIVSAFSTLKLNFTLQ